MRNDLARHFSKVQRAIQRGQDPLEAAFELTNLAAALDDRIRGSAPLNARRLGALRHDVLSERETVLAQANRQRLSRAHSAVDAALGTPRSASVALDSAGNADADRALATTAAHMRQLASQLREALEGAGQDASPELVDLAISLKPATDTLRHASVEARWPSAAAAGRADVGHTVARVGRLAAETLRAEASVRALPPGIPVEDAPSALLWLIADLTVTLRSAGRIGPLGSPTDPGVAARDAADNIVTTFRRWRPRIRGDNGAAIGRAVLTAGFASAWAGLSTIILNDDDACGQRSRLQPTPPGLEGAAEAEPPDVNNSPAIVAAVASTGIERSRTFGVPQVLTR